MAALKNKIDFVGFIAVDMANPNGDPLNGNSPRTDYAGYGEISDVCLKRKVRNRMQDLGYKIFVQSADRCDDGCKSLGDRAVKTLGKPVKDGEASYASAACEAWLDVRSFGQVFAFKALDKVSIGVRGPVSIHQAVSVDPVQIVDMQITKSVNGDDADGGRSSDTMGMKHFVRFGLYKFKGSVNPQLAKKTGFSDDDAEVLKACLKTLFENDMSSARPEGSCRVAGLHWFRHSCAGGDVSSYDVHNSYKAVLKDAGRIPGGIGDYDFVQDDLGILVPEIVL